MWLISFQTSNNQFRDWHQSGSHILKTNVGVESRRSSFSLLALAMVPSLTCERHSPVQHVGIPADNLKQCFCQSTNQITVSLQKRKRLTGCRFVSEFLSNKNKPGKDVFIYPKNFSFLLFDLYLACDILQISMRL